MTGAVTYRAALFVFGFFIKFRTLQLNLKQRITARLNEVEICWMRSEITRHASHRLSAGLWLEHEKRWLPQFWAHR
jgi:hypothetical protein